VRGNYIKFSVNDTFEESFYLQNNYFKVDLLFYGVQILIAVIIFVETVSVMIIFRK
jgi:hypothetical protein